jgi:hypothetical protein
MRGSRSIEYPNFQSLKYTTPTLLPYSLCYLAVREVSWRDLVAFSLANLWTTSIWSFAIGLSGKCSGVYYTNNRLKISLTDPWLASSICCVLDAIKVHCNLGRASPCWCVIQLGVNNCHVSTHIICHISVIAFKTILGDYLDNLSSLRE